MRGRIQLALTSAAVIVGSTVAYHFMDHQSPAIQAESKMSPGPSTVPVAPAAQHLAKVQGQVKHPIRAVMATLGMASFYNDSFDGKRTANGETFDQQLMTACHKTLPFGTLVRVINLATGRSVIVRINDRGDLNRSRVIDLSHAAANEIGMLKAGVARVRLEILAKNGPVEARPL